MTKYATCICGGLKTNGKCDTCAGRTSPRRTTKQRGYGHDWRTLSERIRKEQPLCVHCLDKGKTTPAEQVHHIDTIEQCPERRLDTSNLVPLCKDCHQLEHTGASIQGGG